MKHCSRGRGRGREAGVGGREAGVGRLGQAGRGREAEAGGSHFNCWSAFLYSPVILDPL